MMNLFAIAFALASTLPQCAFSGDAISCSNFSLPNFLNIGEVSHFADILGHVMLPKMTATLGQGGTAWTNRTYECLKAAGDLCTPESDGIVLFLGQLLECTFQGLRTLDIGSQVYLLQEFLKYLLARNDFDIILPLLTNICNSFNSILRLLTAGIVTLSCGELRFDNAAVCGEPIVIIVEATTPFASCLNVSGLTCAGNTPVNEPAIIGFLRTLACLLNYIFTTSPSEALTQLVCGLTTGVAALLGGAGSRNLQSLQCGLQGAVGISCTTLTC